MRCEWCNHWDNSVQPQDEQPDTFGVCRFAPPVADDRNHKARWPFTRYADHCNSFQDIDPDRGRERRLESELREANSKLAEWETFYRRLMKVVKPSEISGFPNRPIPDDVPF